MTLTQGIAVLTAEQVAELASNSAKQAVEQYIKDNPTATQAGGIPLKDIGGVKFAEDITGIKASTIYNKVRNREIPFSKKGNKLFFSRQKLLNWIAEGAVATGKETKGKVDAFIAGV